MGERTTTGAAGDAAQATALLEAALRQRNAASLLLATVLGAVLVSAFWALDWLIMREHVWLTGALRLGCTSYGVLLIALCLRRRGWVERHTHALTFSYMLSVYAAIAAMCWLLGYEAGYYAGLNLVVVAAGLLYLWPLKLAIAFHLVAYAFYMAPLWLGVLAIHDLATVISNQFFLLAMIVLSVAAQQHRFRLERRELEGTLALEQTKRSLEDAYARLKQVDRAKSDFFNNITHELRTPLTMILAPLENLLADELGQLAPEQQSFLRTIHGNALKLLKLINDLLDLARLEDKFLRLEPRRDDLCALLGQLVEFSTPLAARKQIDVQLEVRATSSALVVDPQLIERAVVNLVANALKFSSAGGRVSLILDADADPGGEVRVLVQDDGIGIPREQLETIFERFSQGDASVTRRYGGTGIGLAFAHEIVSLHGGRISVQSEKGQGTTFTIHLPKGAEHFPADVAVDLTDPGDDASASTGEVREWTMELQRRKEYRFLDIVAVTDRRLVERTPAAAGGPKVLVVEDTVELLRYICGLLASGHAVYAAADGKQGLALAQRELPDAVITDYMMPEMDGLALVRALRADPHTADIPILMLTAKKAVEDRLRARQEGADIYLAKPFNPAELRAAVQQLLERRGRQTKHLVKAQVKSLETICAGLSHEIKNPLSYIRNGNAVIAEKMRTLTELVASVPLDDPQRQKVDKIRKRVEQMSAVCEAGVARIDRVVDVVRRYSREGYPCEPSAMPFDATIRDVVKLVRPRDGQDVRVELDLQAGDAAVRCVPDEMQQVIGNLSQNAIDAIPERGSVAIRTRREDGQLLLEVADTGTGIAPENLQRVFSPFFSTKEPGKGMGMGLTIAHQVVTGAGGEIAVDSAPGQGTTFRIRLPVAP